MIDFSETGSDLPPEPRVIRRHPEGRRTARGSSSPEVPSSNDSSVLGRREVYYVVLVAIALAVVMIAPPDELSTLGSLFVCWVMVTAILLPGLKRAGGGLVLALTIVLVARNYGELGASGRFWGGLCLVILASPFIARPLPRVDGFPFVHLFCLFEGVYVYVSVLFARVPPAYQTKFSDEIRTAGFRNLALFLACLVAGSLLAGAILRWLGLPRAGSRTGGSGRQGRTDPPWAVSQGAVARAYLLIIVSAAALVATRVTGVYPALGTLGQLIKLVALGGWLIFVLAWMNGTLRPIHKVTVMIIPIAWVAYTLSETLLFVSASPGFLLLGLWVARRRTVPWLALLGALSLLIVINVGKADVRQDVKKGYADDSATELGVTWLQYAGENLSDTSSSSPLTTSAWRFSNSDLLGYVVTWVPDRFDYYGYEPYTSLPTILLPRLLYPDKPNFGFANEFGRRYEVIERSDLVTAVNTPLHVEAFVTGGYLPLVVVAMVVGLYFRMLQYAFRSVSAASLVTGALVSLHVIWATESGSLAIVPIVPYALFLFAVMWWATRTEPPRPSARP